MFCISLRILIWLNINEIKNIIAAYSKKYKKVDISAKGIQNPNITKVQVFAVAILISNFLFERPKIPISAEIIGFIIIIYITIANVTRSIPSPLSLLKATPHAINNKNSIAPAKYAKKGKNK